MKDHIRRQRKNKMHSSFPPSALCLLPPTLFTIVSLLSPSDREVLAYLILRSLQNPTPLKPKTSNKKCPAPIFDCGCFDCYTSFWTRWDSSANRDLIHQAIEAFEDHLTDISANSHKAIPRRKGNCKNERVSARETNVRVAAARDEQGISEEICGGYSVCAGEGVCEGDEGNVEGEMRRKWSVRRSTEASCISRGLGKKVWPDVLGLCNSRLWNLWYPNA